MSNDLLHRQLLVCERVEGNKGPMPVKGSPTAAGIDLHAIEHHNLAPGERTLIKIGWRIKIPYGHYGQIAPRSGLALKHGIDVLAGVIDADYTGEIGVVLINHGQVEWQVFAGDRIAQLLILPCSTNRFKLVEGDMPKTDRGAGGFGSTGT